MNDLALHRSVLLALLKDFYRDPRLAALLGWKGGTCLHFLEGLPRFSTDLDFSLVPEGSRVPPATVRRILERHLSIRDEKEKRHTWFWLGTYEHARWNVKVEISKRRFPDSFEVRDLYGLSVRTMRLPCILAHKLCALTDRPALANRDLFDAHFLFSKHVPIADAIIEARTGKTTREYLAFLAEHLPSRVSKRGILDGLGELLDPTLKSWAKKNLLPELLFFLRSYGEDPLTPAPSSRHTA